MKTMRVFVNRYVWPVIYIVMLGVVLKDLFQGTLDGGDKAMLTVYAVVATLTALLQTLQDADRLEARR